MDQSPNGHHVGTFDHGPFDYGFDSTDGQVFPGDNVTGSGQAYYAVDDHVSANTQGLSGFQQPATSYPYYQEQFGQQQHAPDHQLHQGMGQYSYTHPTPPPIQSNSYVANAVNTFHDQRVNSPALGNHLDGYQAHATHAGYQAPQLQNKYLAPHSQSTQGAENSLNGHLYRQVQSQSQPKSLQSMRGSPSPQPYQPATHSPYGQLAGQSPAVPQAINRQQISGTQPVHHASVPAQSRPAFRQQPATQPQPIYQPRPQSQPQQTSQHQPQPQAQHQVFSQPVAVQSAPAQVQPSQAPATSQVQTTQACIPQATQATAQSVRASSAQAQPSQAPPSQQLSAIVLVPDPWLAVLPGQSGNASSWGILTRSFTISSQPIQLAKQKYQQTVALFASSRKKRLFPERSFLLPSEALGKFMDGLEDMQELPEAEKETRRKTLYLTLKYDLKRAEHHIDPAELGKVLDKEAKHRKIELPKAFADVRESHGPSADVSCEVAAILEIHSLWGANDALIERIAEDLEDYVVKQVELLRGKAEYKELMPAIKRRREDPTSVTQQALRKLRDVVGPARAKVGRVLTVASEKAEDRVLDKFERHESGQPTILPVLWNLALVCANTSDSGSPLVKGVLEFTTRFASLDDKYLARLKFEPLAPKFEAQGGPEVKAAIAKIRAIAAKNPSSLETTTASQSNKPPSKLKPTTSSKSSTAVKPASSKEMASDFDSISASKVAASSSKKRPVEEGSESSAPKKPATGILQRPAQPAEKPALKLQAASRRTPSILPGRRPVTKPATDQPKASTGSSNPSMSGEASKDRLTVTNPYTLATTTEASKPRAIPANPTSTAVELAKARLSAPPPSSSLSSSSTFSALLAEISEPKQVSRPAARAPEAVPELDETDQERERRLRKEKRRKLNLKVSFKVDAHLAEVRIFHKEEGEDEGLEDNMIRDAADDKAEGTMLKASRRDQITLGREWEEPAPIDFSDIPEEQRRKSYATRGGLITFQTEEQKIMAKEELTQLMVVYTDHGDIPPTPMSPRSTQSTSETKTQAPELPPLANHKWQNRPAERVLYGATEQLNKAWSRKLGLLPAYVVPPSIALSIIEKAKQMPPMVPVDPAARDEAVFQLLNNDGAKNWKDAEPYNPAVPKTAHRTDYADPQVQAAADFMQGMVAQFQGKPAVPQEPPTWMTNPHAREDWWKGFYADQSKADHERHMQEVARRQAAQQQAALLAQTQAAAAHQQNPYAAYYQAYQGHQAPPQQSYAQPGLDPAVQALLASMGQGAQAQHTPALPTDTAALLAQLMGRHGQQAPPAQYSGGYGEDNKYDQENRWDSGDRDGGRNRGGAAAGARGRRERDREDIPDHLKGINRSLIGTKKCLFWAKGQCAKGDKCTFRHE